MVSNQRNIILYLHFDVFRCFLKNFHVQNFDTDKCQDDCEYQKTTSHVTVTPRTIRYLIITLTNEFITTFRKVLLLLSQISKKLFYLSKMI